MSIAAAAAAAFTSVAQMSFRPVLCALSLRPGDACRVNQRTPVQAKDTGISPVLELALRMTAALAP